MNSLVRFRHGTTGSIGSAGAMAAFSVWPAFEAAGVWSSSLQPGLKTL